MRKMVLVIVSFCVSGSTLAESPKGQYWLFHPTPVALMRPMTMDRPDTTETPHTVDAGHFQIEMSLLSYSYDSRNPTHSVTQNFEVAPMVLKMGVLNWMDIELGLTPYSHGSNTDQVTSITETKDGFGDVVTRVKMTLYGNDSGPFCIAALPFIKIPTNQDHMGNDSLEGGVIFPFIIELPHDWSLGGQTQYNWIHRQFGVGHVPDFINIFEVSHGWTRRLGTFVEFFTDVVAEQGVPWVGRIDTGVTFEVTPNFVLDAAANIGITASADDVNPFIGFSYRH